VLAPSLKLSSFISLLAFRCPQMFLYHRFTCGTTIARRLALAGVRLSQSQLITRAMIFACSVLAGSFRARAINFHSAFLSGMGGRFRRRAAFLREMGIDLKNVAAKLHLATRPPPVSGAIGSSLWCPIPADQALAPFFRHLDLLNARLFAFTAKYL